MKKPAILATLMLLAPPMMAADEPCNPDTGGTFHSCITFMLERIGQLEKENRAQQAEIQALKRWALTDGLVAYYPFNGDANDASGNGHHGTVKGATLTADRFGNPESAYQFDGNDSHIQSTISINLAQGITYSVWVFVQKRENKHANLISISHRSFSFFQTDGEFELCLGGCLGHHSVDNVQDNQWQHFVVTIDNKIVKIFVNSEMVKELEVSSSLQDIKGGSLYFGGEKGKDYNLTGIMDELRIYNRALTPKEIQSLYKQP
ncbi:MAG: hypothetical protein DRR19_28055 [Candidatus Parabeggiatoa sp. nov. 1]|nr:MAG: hypothetical protein DRR19_28055 [Gammaproteobacteria bacterium]